MVLEENLDDFRMFLRHGPHQRRLASSGANIDIRAFGKQLFHDSGIAGARGRHQGRFTEKQPGVRIRSCVQKAAHHGFAAVLAGRPQRRGAEIVGGVYLCAGPDQQIRRIEVVAVAGPV